MKQMSRKFPLNNGRLHRLAWLIAGADGLSWAQGDGCTYTFNPAEAEALDILTEIDSPPKPISWRQT